MRALPIIAVVWIGCDAAEIPQLDRIEPMAAARGQHVVLWGNGFCGTGPGADNGNCDPLPTGRVDFSLVLPAVRAPVLRWHDGSIEVEVPSAVDIGESTVYVTVDGRSSNGVTFEVLP